MSDLNGAAETAPPPFVQIALLPDNRIAVSGNIPDPLETINLMCRGILAAVGEQQRRQTSPVAPSKILLANGALPR